MEKEEVNTNKRKCPECGRTLRTKNFVLNKLKGLVCKQCDKRIGNNKWFNPKKDREFMSFLKSLMKGKDYSVFPSTSIKMIQDKILELSMKGKINIQKSNRTERRYKK